jgi:hypothetical protein
MTCQRLPGGSRLRLWNRQKPTDGRCACRLTSADHEGYGKTLLGTKSRLSARPGGPVSRMARCCNLLKKEFDVLLYGRPQPGV